MRKVSLSAWDVSQANLRVLFVLFLGLLGVKLFPGKMEFFPNPFSDISLVSFEFWLIAILLSVIVIYRAERVQYFSENSIDRDWVMQNQDQPSWLVRIGIVILSPLVLAVSRPEIDTESSSVMRKIIRAAFTIFPYAIAIGYSFILWTSIHGFSDFAMKCFAFSLWAYVGCVLIFLFCPVRKGQGVPFFDVLPEERKINPFGTVFLMLLITAAFMSFAYIPIGGILNGNILKNDIHRIGALDQAGVAKCVFLFIWFSILLLPYMASVRWLTRRTQWRYVTWGFPSVIIAVGLISLLIWAGAYLPDGAGYEKP